MKYDTIVFDLDGTLLNTLDDLTDSVNFALTCFSFPTRTIEEVQSFVGNGVKQLIDLAVPLGTSEKDASACLRIFKEHYSCNMQNKTHPYDGIIPLLAALKAKGIKMAVVSNKFDHAVKNLCADFFSNFISVAVGESPGVKKKPAPDSVYSALDVLQSNARSSIYVGDSEVDLETAKNAGLSCVLVAWGFRDKADLLFKGAIEVIDEPSQLLDFL